MLSKSQKGKVEFMVHYVALTNRLDLKISPHKSFHHPLLKLFSPTTHPKPAQNIGQIDFVQTSTIHWRLLE